MDEYIKYQINISGNLITVNDYHIDETFCAGYRYKALTKYKDFIPAQYGEAIDSTSEYTYPVIKESSDKFLDTHIKNETKVLWESIYNYMKTKYNVELQLWDGHLNANMAGSHSIIHTDEGDKCHLFCLVFFNDDMNIYQGGEFQTYVSLKEEEGYDDDDLSKNKKLHKDIYNQPFQINHTISPKVGRIVFADSRIYHRGLSPTSLYKHARLTIVFKLKFKNVDDAFNKLGWIKEYGKGHNGI